MSSGAGVGSWGEVVLTGSCGLWPPAGRPPTKRVCGRGPSSPWCRWPGPSWLWAQTPSVTSLIRVFSQRTDTWEWEGTSGWELPGPPPRPAPPRPAPASPLPSPSLYATGQSVNAGGSGLGAGAQGLRSERQSVRGSGRGLGKGCWPSAGQRGAGALGGHAGG